MALAELLSAQRVFQGVTATEILADVLKSDPDWNRLPAQVPRRLQQLLRRCLQKDVRSRYHDVADVRIALEDLQSDASSLVEDKTGIVRVQWYERIVWLALLLGIVVTGLVWVTRRPSPQAEERADIVTPPEAMTGKPRSLSCIRSSRVPRSTPCIMPSLAMFV